MVPIFSPPVGQAVVTMTAQSIFPWGPYLSQDAKRLHWTLEGPLTTAIQVMKQPYYDPDTVMEPYCQQNVDGTSVWSPVSQAPISEPKVSSLVVRVVELDDWERSWLELHDECEVLKDYPGAGLDFGPVMGQLPDYDPEEDEEAWVPEPCSDDEDDEDDEGPGTDAASTQQPAWIVRCCGHERPRKKKVSLLVRASGEFVTIHDYVSAVHPWLLSLREDLLMVNGDLWHSIPLPADTRLMFECSLTGKISAKEEKDWCFSGWRRPPPSSVAPRGPDPDIATFSWQPMVLSSRELLPLGVETASKRCRLAQVDRRSECNLEPSFRHGKLLQYTLEPLQDCSG